MFLVGSYNQAVFYLLITYVLVTIRYNLKIHFSQEELVVKNPFANAGDMRCRFSPWVGKIPWRRAWQPHSSILAWRIPWTEETGGLQSMGSHRVGHD